MRVGTPAAIETDVVVIGAGPVGLFQVFELGLLELSAHLVDSLPHIGGQCTELYADKPIYDIPGLARCTGRELVDRLERQVAPFRPQVHLAQQVSEVRARSDAEGGGFDVATDRGLRFACRAVVIAGGVGSFQPRRIAVDGLERHRGIQLFDQDPPVEALAGKHVVIAGGGPPVVASALGALAAEAASVTVLHRRDELDADTGETPMLDAFDARRSEGAIGYVAGVATAVREGADGGGDRRLTGLAIATRDGRDIELLCDVLVARLGWSPKLGPIAGFGVALEKKQVVVDAERFETSVPGLHAVGDVVTYPGKRKLIVCGFHEATLAAYAIAARLKPDNAEPTLYTTTSSKLHRLLGV